MPIDAAQLEAEWAPRVADGIVDDFLCPVGSDDDDWVGQFMFDAGRWTLQVRPAHLKAFLEAHPGWSELGSGTVFRNIAGDVPLAEVCADVAAVVATIEVDAGPLELVTEE